MIQGKKISAFALASAAALLFSTAPIAVTQAAEGKVKCQGANACKGKSACATAKSACSGQNSCKGQGYVLSATQAECDAAKAAAAKDGKAKS